MTASRPAGVVAARGGRRGVALLVAGARLLVEGAVGIAEGFGVSGLVIGLTVVAVDTSLPELATSLIAVRRGPTR